MDIIKKINNSASIWEILPTLSIEDLEDAIKVAADAYYNKNTSLITDNQFDLLIERLKILNPQSKALKKIGAHVKGKKVKLPYTMGSMNKIKTDNAQLDKWTQKYSGPYVISDKLDGISCLLNITNSTSSLYTRGDGVYGQNISHLMDTINIPIDWNKLPTGNIAIRGELIMSIQKFKKYAKIMSNARNMVAGIVNSKISSLNLTHARDVDFVAYEIITPHLIPSDQFVKLEEWGLLVVKYSKVDTITGDKLEKILKKRKSTSIYEIDGLIVTDDFKHARNISGNPPYSFAYKGMTETADVKVKAVIWTPSKDGILVPRIHYQEVRLSQANLDHTTGFNAKYIVDNKIGKDAIIRIVRSGDVIPYILAIIKSAAEPDLPDRNDYKWDNNHVNFVLKNINNDKTVIIKRLTKFVKDIGVDNMSIGIITKLVNNDFDNIIKIISMNVDDFLSIEGIQETMANKLYNSIQHALDNIDLLNLMVASNLFGKGFGHRKLKKILDAYPDIVDKYTIKTRKQWFNKLIDLEGFDTITIDSFLDRLPNFQIFYDKFDDIVEVKEHSINIKQNGKFQNQTIVFTGFRDRDWQNIIESEGGKVSKSVNQKTSLLVYKNGKESSSNYIKAKQLGIPMMTQQQFEKKIESLIT